MNSNFIKIVVLVISILFLSACSQAEKAEHIEAFAAEVLEENAEGLFVKTGYQKVNAITVLEEGKNYIRVDVKSVEDFYDTEWNYLRTEIIHSKAKKSSVTQVEDVKEKKDEVNEPSVILVPEEDVKMHKLILLTEDEQEKVKKHVLSFMDKL